jgi:hypothetical protein
MTTGGIFAAILIATAIGAQDDAHRARAAAIAAMGLLVAIPGWRGNRIVTHVRGVDITADVRTRHLLWNEIGSFSYGVARVGGVGLLRLCLVITFKSGAKWRIPQISCSPSRGEGSRVAKIAGCRSAELAERDAHRASTPWVASSRTATVQTSQSQPPSAPDGEQKTCVANLRVGGRIPRKCSIHQRSATVRTSRSRCPHPSHRVIVRGRALSRQLHGKRCFRRSGCASSVRGSWARLESLLIIMVRTSGRGTWRFG